MSKNKGVIKKKMEHKGAYTPYGLCHFLICLRNPESEKLKKSYPDAKWPKPGHLYSVKSLYYLEDDMSKAGVPFVELNEINLGKKDIGYLMFNFAPFPFSPN